MRYLKLFSIVGPNNETAAYADFVDAPSSGCNDISGYEIVTWDTVEVEDDFPLRDFNSTIMESKSLEEIIAKVQDFRISA